MIFPADVLIVLKYVSAGLFIEKIERGIIVPVGHAGSSIVALGSTRKNEEITGFLA